MRDIFKIISPSFLPVTVKSSCPFFRFLQTIMNRRQKQKTKRGISRRTGRQTVNIIKKGPKLLTLLLASLTSPYDSPRVGQKQSFRLLWFRFFTNWTCVAIFIIIRHVQEPSTSRAAYAWTNVYLARWLGSLTD